MGKLVKESGMRAAALFLVVLVGCGRESGAPTTYAVGRLECLEPRGITRNFEFDPTIGGAETASIALEGWFERAGASISMNDVAQVATSSAADAAPLTFVRVLGARRTAEFRVQELDMGWFITGFSICHEDRGLLGSEVRG